MEDERLDWFPCNPSKLLGALAQMDPREGYVYVVVLLRIYEIGGPCRDHVDALAKRARMTARAVEAALEVLVRDRKLVRTEAGIVNPYAERVLGDQRERRASAKNSGKKGAEKRWKKTKENQRSVGGSPTSTPMPKDGYLESQIEKKEGKTDSPAGAGLFPEDVSRSDWPKDYQEQFWATYPRRTEKKAAMSKLDAVRRSGKVAWAAFFEGVRRYARQTAGTEMRYVKHPTTWLNRGCWDDEPPPPGPSSGGGSPRAPHGMAGFALHMMRRNDQED